MQTGSELNIAHHVPTITRPLREQQWAKYTAGQVIGEMSKVEAFSQWKTFMQKNADAKHNANGRPVAQLAADRGKCRPHAGHDIFVGGVMNARRRPFGYFAALCLLCVVISFLGFVVWAASVAGAVTGGGREVPEWPMMLWCGSWLLLGRVHSNQI